MQAEGEGEPWLGTITWKVPGTDEQRSGTGVLIGPDVVCTPAELLYHAGQTIVTGTFDLGRVRGQNAPREVDIIDCYLPPWYIHYENARSPLSRYHNFAFVKLARKIPGAPGLAMSDALPGLAADSWLTLYHASTGRTRLKVEAGALRYAREDLKQYVLAACPRLLCLTTADPDPTALPVLLDGDLAGLAVARPSAVRDNGTIFGVDILLSGPYMRWERRNAETKFEHFRTAMGDRGRSGCLVKAAEDPPAAGIVYWDFVKEARHVYGERQAWPAAVLRMARQLRRHRTTEVPRPWHELQDYAADLPRRRAAQAPYSMLEHLCQRVGESQRRVRPPVRVRVATPDGLRYADVSAANVARVCAAAGTIPWTDSADEGWERLKLLIGPAAKKPEQSQPACSPAPDSSSWAPFPEGESSRSWIATWLTMQKIPTELRRRRSEFTEVVNAAGRAITSWVEPEVLELIGWPVIHVHNEDSTELPGDGRAHYDSRTQTIHIKVSALNREQLLHEFGHHLEEQGPVEVWCGLASYLMAGAENRPLAEPGRSSREPVYAWLTRADPHGYGEVPPMPKVPYALSYYSDGGTELIALGLELSVPEEPNRFIRWPGHSTGYQPEYLWHLLRAIRPRMCLEYEIAVPALLDRP